MDAPLDELTISGGSISNVSLRDLGLSAALIIRFWCSKCKCSFENISGDKRKFLSCLLTLKTEVDTETQAPTPKLAVSSLKWLAEKADITEAVNVDDIQVHAKTRYNKKLDY